MLSVQGRIPKATMFLSAGHCQCSYTRQDAVQAEMDADVPGLSGSSGACSLNQQGLEINKQA